MIAQPVLPQALGTADSPQFAGVNIGAAADTTITRVGAGQIAVEGSNLIRASDLGANVGTFLATPSSANLAAALTDETGSGLAVFGTAPTLTRPILGSYTWAALQTAYPNNGAAIDALTVGTLVFVTDWNVFMTPDAARNYWVFTQATIVAFNKTPVTGSTSGNEQIVISTLVAAGVLRAGRKFAVRAAYGKVAASTDLVSSANLRCGTGNATSDASLMGGPSLTAAQRSATIEIEFLIDSATQLSHYGSQTNTAWAGIASALVNPTTNAISDLDANGLYFSLSVDMAGTTDAPMGYSIEVEVSP